MRGGERAGEGLGRRALAQFWASNSGFRVRLQARGGLNLGFSAELFGFSDILSFNLWTARNSGAEFELQPISVFSKHVPNFLGFGVEFISMTSGPKTGPTSPHVCITSPHVCITGRKCRVSACKCACCVCVPKQHAGECTRGGGREAKTRGAADGVVGQPGRQWADRSAAVWWIFSVARPAMLFCGAAFLSCVAPGGSGSGEGSRRGGGWSLAKNTCVV